MSCWKHDDQDDNQDLLDAILGSFRWWRKFKGGHWEYWTVMLHPVPYQTIQNWYRVEKCSQTWNGDIPYPLCFGTPTCEDW